MLNANAVPSDVIAAAILDTRYKPGTGWSHGEDDHGYLCNVIDQPKYAAMFGYELCEKTKALIHDAIKPHFTLSVWYAHKYQMPMTKHGALNFWAGFIITLKSEGR